MCVVHQFACSYNRDASWTCKHILNFIINALIFLVSKLKSLKYHIKKVKSLAALFSKRIVHLFIFSWNSAFLFKISWFQEISWKLATLIQETMFTQMLYWYLATCTTQGTDRQYYRWRANTIDAWPPQIHCLQLPSSLFYSFLKNMNTLILGYESVDACTWSTFIKISFMTLIHVTFRNLISMCNPRLPFTWSLMS